MRRFLFCALALSALGSPASGVSAQSCSSPTRIDFIRELSGCSYEHSDPLCAPGGTVTLQADVHTATPQACPYTVSWDFGDGVQEQAEGNTIQHVFTGSGRRKVTASVQTPSGVKKYEKVLVIAYGYFDLRPVSRVVSEGDAFTTTVKRDDASAPASIDYATEPSPALVQKSGKLSFAPGETQKQVTFQTIENDFSSDDVLAYVSWSNPVNYAVENGGGTTFISITDDDRPTFHRCTRTTMTVNERDGVARIEMNRTGELEVASTGTATIRYRPTMNWFQPIGTWSVPFEPGQAKGFIEIPIENNDSWDGLQQAVVACGGHVGSGPSSSDSELLLTLVDDDAEPVLTVPQTVLVSESDATTTIDIPVTLSAGFAHGAAVGIKAEDDTATRKDYVLRTTTLFFESGVTSQPIAIEVTGDNVAENDEQFTITLVGDVTGKFKVRIADDDRPPFAVHFDRPSYVADETSASVTLTRSGDVSQPGVVTLLFETLTGLGHWPADFDVRFETGQTTKTVAIPADDDWYTGDRTATVELRSAGLTGATAELTLRDDDPQPVVSLLGATATEGAPGEVTPVTVTIRLSAPLGVDLDVLARTTSGTAGADDYTPLGETRVSIRRGEMTATLTLEVRGDEVAEGSETFTVDLTQCCDPAVAGGPLTATITIHDDDAPPPARRRSVRH